MGRVAGRDRVVSAIGRHRKIESCLDRTLGLIRVHVTCYMCYTSYDYHSCLNTNYICSELCCLKGKVGAVEGPWNPNAELIVLRGS